MKNDKSLTALAGEFYVLAQLAHRGLIGTMTLSNTKSVDILVANQHLDKLFKLEVKTTNGGDWMMSKKHENMREKNLFFCFVQLKDENFLPNFYIVPSSYVANHVRAEHRKWMKRRKHKKKPTNLRKFKISIDDPRHFKDAWKVFLS